MAPEQIKHHCISCGQNLNIYGGPASACNHGWLCEICQDSSECPSCAIEEENAIDSGHADDFADHYFTRSN